MTSFTQIESTIATLHSSPSSFADPVFELLDCSEKILENWLEAHGEVATQEKREGFRLLALHRQISKMDPTFNACRETCREIAYYSNLLQQKITTERVELSAMIARHLLYFVQGKIENQQLGEFCCSSKSIRANNTES